MPQRLYKILLFFGIAAAILSIPAFWFSYPVLDDWLTEGEAAGDLIVYFIDVGQGDAALIKTPDGQNILLDGGPDAAAARALGRLLPFWERTIDLVILSHPHDDHVNGLNDIFRRYEVRQAAYSGVVHTSPGYLAWLKLARNNSVPLLIIDRPQTIVLGDGCALHFLYPRESLLGRSVSNLNNSSLVAKLVYGETAFLFTGDIEGEVERELLSPADGEAPGDAGIDIDLRAQVLKVGHHGSDTSSSAEFIAAVRPEIAVISVGADNKFGHPSPRVINRLERSGAATYRTDLHGTVKIRSDGKEIFY